MKTYGYYLILHILGLTGLIAAAVLAMLHGLWFCTIICGLLLVGICYSLYRIQIRQTETMYRLVECMKQNDLGQRVCAPLPTRRCRSSRRAFTGPEEPAHPYSR